MFCIASYIIFAILGIFSLEYRKLAKKGWYCVVRKVTFRPCDINFAEEVKGKLLGKLIIKKPHLAKFLNKWFDWIAFAFVILSIWSVLTAFNASLNLWVYGTCNGNTGESCSLSGEACGVSRNDIGFIDAVRNNQIDVWVTAPFKNFADTISRIPNRLKNWDAKEYLSSTATFYNKEDLSKVYAIEIMDPGCVYCKKLFNNIKESGFENKYNFSYILYPIPDAKKENGYKFANSYLMASYIEASKTLHNGSDWYLLEKIFTAKDEENIEWQNKINMILNANEAEEALKDFLKEAGNSDEQIDQVYRLVHGDEIKALLNEQKDIVENKVRTIRIPTLIFGGRRYDRVVDRDVLES